MRVTRLIVVILVQMAREPGYEATGTIDPFDALDQIRTLSPEVVLLDLHMPRLGGEELLVRIAAAPSAPAIIVMAGWVDEHTHDMCRRHGAADIVRKPFELDDLFRRLDAAMHLVRAR